MVKYCGQYVTFQEVPNEVSLTLSITNCPRRCEGCHSPWLREDIGNELTEGELRYMLDGYPGGITCVCFMGTGKTPHDLAPLVLAAHASGYKVCIYDGCDTPDLLEFLQGLGDVRYLPDYYKYGSYQKDRGGLASPTTNQRMLKLWPAYQYQDITDWFWKQKKKRDE